MANPQYRHYIGIKQKSLNLLNPKTVEDGFTLSTTDGQPIPNISFGVSGLIPINPNRNYTGLNTESTSQVFRIVAFYDFSRRFIASTVNYSTGFTSPDNAYFVRLSLPNKLVDPDYSYEKIGLFEGLTPVFQPFDFYTTRGVKPIYNEDVSKETEMVSGYWFYRSKLNGEFSLVRNDYRFILNAPIGSEFLHRVEKSMDQGTTWSEYYRGRFTKTMCRFNDTDQKVSFESEPLDEYVDVLAGLDKEFDLIKLSPRIQSILLQKRPVIQVYVPGDTVVSCFLGGTYWEQSSESILDRSELTNTYKFALASVLKEVNVTTDDPNLPVSGLYTGRMTVTTQSGTEFLRGILQSSQAPNYYLDVEQTSTGSSFSTFIQIIDSSTNVVLQEFFEESSSDIYDSFDFTFTPGVNNANIFGEVATYRIYARYLCDVNSIQGTPTFPVPLNDITENSRAYRRVLGYGINIAYISETFSNAPTEWGLSEGDKYFLPPFTSFGQNFFPIARSTWRRASVWFGFTQGDALLEASARQSYLLRDTFPISAVLDSILAEITGGIRHEEKPEYSEFLYGSGNLTPINTVRTRMFMSPKSNLLVGVYDEPAKKAEIKLSDITSMLRDCFDLHWFVENGRFRIEHVSWFKNGGSYGTTPVLSVDLTLYRNPRNLLPWDFAKNQWEYVQEGLVQTYQYKWMDTVTPAFEGDPIEVTSGYVQKGQIETVQVGRFSTDVDYIVTGPSDVSKDGFVLFGAVNGEALATPDNVLGGTDLITDTESPVYVLKQGYEGRSAQAKFIAQSALGAFGFITFYEDGVKISEQAGPFEIGLSQALSVNVTIPDNANGVGFRVVGSASFVFQSLEVASLPELPLVERFDNGINLVSQNGYLAWSYLQPSYLLYNMSGKDLIVNGFEATARGIKRNKVQELRFPTKVEIDPKKLIKTNLGFGKIEKISVNLTSLMNTINIRHDTE